MTLKETYEEIRKFSKEKIENFGTIKSVQEHRNFWKPKKVKILLLAESHVYTFKEENKIEIDYSKNTSYLNIPKKFVRLVYCLGYGERKLSNIRHNFGTPQFWKIFASCVNKDFNSEFKKILISKTPNLKERINNKISLLKNLKEKGIWLVDASIVALYHKNEKPSQKTMKKIINISWEKYISQTIKESYPEKIIVIGKNVANILSKKLKETKIPFYIQPQPQARMSKENIEKTFKKYYSLCNT